MESSEHRYIGDQVRVPSASGVTTNADGVVVLTLTSPNVADISLSYGEVVALGGDFYGTPSEEPISSGRSFEERVGLFLSAHNTLVRGDRIELGRIREILDRESSIVFGTDKPAAAFAELGLKLYFEWNEATGGAPASDGVYGMATKPGRYTRLAKRNLDHFGADAALAYRAGHAAACQTASSDLNAALAMNAHADHFLSDMFASGHIRTPRRVLNEYQWHLSGIVDGVTIGSLLSRAMHDEENRTGLTVTSHASDGHSWQAFGDCQVLEQRSSDNRNAAVAALQTSADEVIAATASTSTAPAFAALEHTPFVAGPYPPTRGPSIAPMLVAEGHEPLARTGTMWGIPTPGLGRTDDYTYTGSFLWESVVAETLGPGFVSDLTNGIFVWLGK